jgi:hypothetical protein
VTVADGFEVVGSYRIPSVTARRQALSDGIRNLPTAGSAIARRLGWWRRLASRRMECGRSDE